MYLEITLTGLLVVAAIDLFLSFYKNNKKTSNTTEKQSKTYTELIMQSEEPYQKINKLIDDFIEEASNSYLILNRYEREDYMNKEFVDKYEKYVISFIQKNMSDSVVETIGVFYDLRNDQDLQRILKLRTKLFLIKVVAGNNVSIQD